MLGPEVVYLSPSPRPKGQDLSTGASLGQVSRSPVAAGLGAYDRRVAGSRDPIEEADEPIRVFIVDDHGLVRRGVRSYLAIFDDIEVEAALQAGAAGYLVKDAAPEELVVAIRTARRGEIHIDGALAPTATPTRRSPGNW